jgi:hypothetical protein
LPTKPWQRAGRSSCRFPHNKPRERHSSKGDFANLPDITRSRCTVTVASHRGVQTNRKKPRNPAAKSGHFSGLFPWHLRSTDHLEVPLPGGSQISLRLAREVSPKLASSNSKRKTFFLTHEEVAGSWALVAGDSFQSFPAEDFRCEFGRLQLIRISPPANRAGHIFSWVGRIFSLWANSSSRPGVETLPQAGADGRLSGL